MGLPTPRPTLRLVKNLDSKYPYADAKLMCPSNGKDYTARMKAWAARRLDELEAQKISGFVFKRDSPSSGLIGVKVYDAVEIGNASRKKGMGMFTRAFITRFPLIPVEEEGRLNDPKLRENFIERLFTMARLRTIAKLTPTIEALITFHRSMRLVLYAHNEDCVSAMDVLLESNLKSRTPASFNEICTSYAHQLTDCLLHIKHPENHKRVFEYVIGLLSDDMTPRDTRELHNSLHDYLQGYVPLIAPITLLKHHVNRCNCAPEWLKHQLYLNPGPKELQLQSSHAGNLGRIATVAKFRNMSLTAEKQALTSSSSGGGCDTCDSGCGSNSKFEW